MRMVLVTLAAAVGCAVGSLHAEDGYIESLGRQIVNLRAYKTPNTRIWLDFQPSSASPGFWYFGTHGEKTGSWLGCYGDTNGRFYVKYGDAAGGNFVPLANLDAARHTLYVALNEDGRGSHRFIFTTAGREVLNVVQSAASNVTTTNCPMMLFGLGWDYKNGEYASHSTAMKVYGVKIWEGDELIHDYVPRKVEGKYYLKDLVDGAFVTGVARKDGTALAELLTGGGDIVEEAGDGYIESTGNQKLGLGVKADAATRVELDHQLVDPAGNGGEGYLFGSRSGSMLTFWGWYAASGTRIGYACQTGGNVWDSSVNYFDTHAKDGIMAAELRRTLVVDAPNHRASYETAGYECSARENPNTISGETPQPMALFTTRLNDGWELTKTAKMKFYGMNIYTNGVLRKRFTPYIKAATAGIIDEAGNFTMADDDLSMTNVASCFRVGGAIAGDAGKDDVFLETTGHEFVDSGFLATANTKVVMDFAQLTPGYNHIPADAYLFGARDSGTGPHFATVMEAWFMGFNTGTTTWQGGTKSGKTARISNFGRTVLTMDGKNRVVSLTRGGKTLFEIGLEEALDMQVNTLAIMSMKYGPTSFAQAAKIRLYSCKIYDNDTLVRAYYPMTAANGDIGLYDRVNGTFAAVSKSYGARVRGWKVDGVAQGFSQPLPSQTELYRGSRDTKVLAVAAPEAVAYVWRRDGKVIADATGPTCTIRCGEAYERNLYSVAPVYLASPVVGAEDRLVEGVAISCEVLSHGPGTTMLFR